jgi:hypothetical protein
MVGTKQINFINSNMFICLIPMNTDADSGTYLLGREDKEILDDYIKNEQRQRQNGRRKGTILPTSTQPPTRPISTPKREASTFTTGSCSNHSYYKKWHAGNNKPHQLLKVTFSCDTLSEFSLITIHRSSSYLSNPYYIL